VNLAVGGHSSEYVLEAGGVVQSCIYCLSMKSMVWEI